jgi:hypothetical protein
MMEDAEHRFERRWIFLQLAQFFQVSSVGGCCLLRDTRGSPTITARNLQKLASHKVLGMGSGSGKQAKSYSKLRSRIGTENKKKGHTSLVCNALCFGPLRFR